MHHQQSALKYATETWIIETLFFLNSFLLEQALEGSGYANVEDRQ